MKAISIKQPWASLIITFPFNKDVENRTWKTNYRGDLLIHASKIQDKNFPKLVNAPLGCIIGICDLFYVTKQTISEWHKAGFYGFYLRDIKRFIETIPYSGKRGLYDVSDDLVKEAIFNAIPADVPQPKGRIE